MATSANYFCSLCQEDNETSTAVTWCAECEVFLCPECQKHHGRSKMSKHHQVMSLHDYHNLPEFILKIKNNCENHNLRYELFCSFHDAACCIKCLKDQHGDCKGLVPLAEVVGNIKSSAFVSQVENDLIILLENFKTIKIFFSENLNALQKQKAEAISSVQNMRQSINEYLDKLEKCLLIDIESEFTKTRDIIQNLKSEIESKTNQIGQKHRDFSQMVEFSTDLQTYFGIHEIEKIRKEEDSYIDNLKSADNLREKRLEVDVSFDIESIIKQSKTLGKVTICISPDDLQLKTKEEQQVQLPQLTVLGQIEPTIKQSFEMPKQSLRITGCEILPNGNVMFLDKLQKCLLLFNIAGEFQREIITFENKPSDVCYVRQNEVAVTVYKKVCMVDAEKNKIVKEKNIEADCYGICTYEQTVYVRVLPNRVLVLDFELDFQYQIQIFGETLTRIAVFGDKLFCTDCGKNTIFCYNKAGEMVWSYNHGIISPMGIDVDRNGFVYVACKGTNKIIALSQDGTKSRDIMSEDSGVNKPFALNIDRKMSVLVFSNERDKSAFLLSI
ncbi:uncharacterized protein [Mytilus edulis]|uniref:uncharacterized protein n=1 Tax=Mytilus edulis TaxID=6550 RepID=UPI0039EE30B9